MQSKGPHTPNRQHWTTPNTPTVNRTPRRTPQRISQQSQYTPTRSTQSTPFHGDSFKPTVPPPAAPNFSDQLSVSSPTTPNTQDNDPNFFAYNPEKEPIKAYLRIRPSAPRATDQNNISSASQYSNPFLAENSLPVATSTSMPPYLKITDSSEVCMTPPEDSNAYRTRNRAPERYRFTKIFTETISQQDFFNQTTLPLIKDVLTGGNALIFAYGVTNSGKSYSIMGTRENTGLLPRTLDVIFNSVQDYTSDSKLKPVMHSMIQAYEDDAEENRFILDRAGSFENAHLGSSNCDLWEGHPAPSHSDTTVIPIDGKYEYGIWVSYAEIYTERIYDLLVAPDKHRKRKSLALKYEFRSGHKYIAGLTQVKVRSIDEAYAILRQGQRNRAVFSTLMNQTSSRSHSIFTIRIVRTPIYENEYVIEDPSYAVVSKMSIVDLAGSERYRNTLNSGQRLKEAGNINKSLMVLGQCMETLRLNQLKASMGKRDAIVPFHHSKLTELFKSSFKGDGKAVMVVNVNPSDTGFDENSHVMKFAAVAKDVATWRRIHPKLDLHGISTASRRRRTQEKRVENRSSNDLSQELADAMDVCQSTDEEEDGDDDDDDGDDLDDPFVDNLIAQWADLRDKWTDAETRCATMESEIRQQVSKEMEIELHKMEDIYMSRMINKNNSATADINQYMNHLGHSVDAEANLFLNQLYQRQETLASELDKMQNRMQEHDITKQTLLKKIAELEKDKSKDQGVIQQLNETIQQRDQRIHDLQHYQSHQNSKPYQVDEPMDEANPFLEKQPRQKQLPVNQDAPETDVAKQSSMAALHSTQSTNSSHMSPLSISHTTPQRNDKKRPHSHFDDFLDLRKKLRRSVFKSEECASDADEIMTKVENFKDVTFEMVKESSMGKLLKLISQHQFKNDHCHLKERAKALLTHYVSLNIPLFAPPIHHPKQRKHNNRGSLITVSVDAGKEEELISAMRDTMDLLQHENRKLKSRLKTMEDSQRRLMDAFDNKSTHVTPTPKYSVDDAAPTTMMVDDAGKEQNDDEIGYDDGDDDNDDVLLSPVLGGSAMMMDEIDEIADFDREENRPKRPRKLRMRQN